MKKLMIAAASAAMIGGAFADGQVYEMTLNVKTTEAKSGTVEVKVDSDTVCYSSQSYRKQASVKVAGLFWGCDCETIGDPAQDLDKDSGYFFWSATKKAAFYDSDAEEYIKPEFTWDILNRIGPKAADCEGVWDLTYGDAVLRGAGFGKVCGYESSAYIKSMSGNFAGTTNPGQACKRCEEQKADAWQLCECGDSDSDLTAAYGTWTLKFNSSASKKFANSEDWSWYKFPGDVLTAILKLMGEEKKTCESEAEVLAKAKVALAAAEENLERAEANKLAVSDDVLKAAVTNLQAQEDTILYGNDAWLAISNMYGIATKATFKEFGFQMGWSDQFGAYDWNRSILWNDNYYYGDGHTGATNKYINALAAAEEAKAPVSANRYSIWVNDEVAATTKYGSVNAAAYIAQQYAAIPYGSKIKIQAYLDPDGITTDPDRSVTAEDGNFTQELVNKYAAFATADKAALATAEAAKANATTALSDAIAAMKAIFDKDVQIASDLEDAEDNWANRKSLQATAELAVREAEQDVDDAEAVVETAQKAYDKCAE